MMTDNFTEMVLRLASEKDTTAGKGAGRNFILSPQELISIVRSAVTSYTADQIRKAQVEVLREARDRMAVTNELNPLVFLDRMADELEGSKT